LTKDEALKLALEALTYIYTETTADEDELIDQAITVIKEALTQPEQEPVAWYDKHGMITHDPFEGVTPLYTTPPAPQPAQEPPSEWALIKNILDEYGLQAISFVADWKAAQPEQEPQVRTGNCLLCGVCASEGHKIQAKRPWVGLTEQQIRKICGSVPSIREAVKEAETKLKEKNGL